MASNGTVAPEDAQQRSAPTQTRQHTRAQSSGNQSSSSSSSNPLAASSSIAAPSSTPAASATALPRISSSTPAPSPFTTVAPTRLAGQTRPASVAPAPAPVPAPAPARASTGASSSTSTASTATPRRDATPNSSLASHLSTQQSNPPPIASANSSIFGYLGAPRQTGEEMSAHQPNQWRFGPSTSSAVAASSSIPLRSNTPNSAFSVQPGLRSTFGNAGSGNSTNASAAAANNSNNSGITSWNSQLNRGGGFHHGLQHQQTQVGSPARGNAMPAQPWIGNQNGAHNSYHNGGTSSGWTLADPAGWSGWARSDRVHSGFEENQVVSFTWSILEANLLRDEVERSPLPSDGGRSISAGAGKSEVWTTQPIFGDGKWKLELVRTSRPGEGEPEQTSVDTEQDPEGNGKGTKSNGTTVLSAYLTCMVLDYSPAELEIPASVMIGIKPLHSPEKTSRSGSWIWQEFAHHVFRREGEYYECHQVPSLSRLLEDKDVQSQDAFSLTVQVSTGPRAAALAYPTSTQVLGRRAVHASQASPFVVQDCQLVHHSLIDGLERLLDCKSTGDVVLIVRERGIMRKRRGGAEGAIEGGADDEVWTLPVGTPMYEWATSEKGAEEGGEHEVGVRDRLLWAHSSILGARSEFFNDMLQSHFAEGQEQDLSLAEGRGKTSEVHGRRVKTLRIKDADFTTIYWLLRYLYLEEVEFLPREDVRCAALDDEWMTLGEGQPGKRGLRAVWQWTRQSQLESSGYERQEQAIQATTAADLSASYHHPSSHGHSRHGPSSLSQSSTAAPESSHPHHAPTSPGRLRSNLPHEMYGGYQRRTGSDWEPRSVRTFSQDATALQTSPPTRSDGHCSESESLLMDPHSHPCVKPPPASALALYRLAHRYHQQGLAHLSKIQLITSLTPQTAFPTLLATNLYDDLYEPVKAYVLDKWDLVSQTSEFERCCDEVSAGEWGLEAGRALRVFMRSLLSPARAR